MPYGSGRRVGSRSPNYNAGLGILQLTPDVQVSIRQFVLAYDHVADGMLAAHVFKGMHEKIR